jgi:hypothetical protein
MAKKHVFGSSEGIAVAGCQTLAWALGVQVLILILKFYAVMCTVSVEVD